MTECSVLSTVMLRHEWSASQAERLITYFSTSLGLPGSSALSGLLSACQSSSDGAADRKAFIIIIIIIIIIIVHSDQQLISYI